ncbi:hypothetical protein ABZ883_42280 [Streptomyces sp. NPDC046977]|uniref:hypothetical protein n=1 Tax=Streptomyces sp. NPDC046977 TaxID=3154703 RepID=UPI0033F4E165
MIDDAQWLDPGSAEVLGFVAHRIGADPLGIAFATRCTEDGFRGLPEVVLRGLGPGDARALLGSALHAPLDEAVAARISVEARGNPLALLELPRTVPAVAFAGGFGPPSTATLPGRIEDSFRDRVLALAPATRLFLLLAAAEPLGDAALLWRAAERLRITSSAALAAEDEGLLSIGTQVVFRHPLVRSAVYGAASPVQRHAVHRALADVTGPEDHDRRAWHRAQAAVGFDAEAAAELERSAHRAQARGGVAAAAAFLERAVTLTPDPASRADRALGAARAGQQAGAYEDALHLLSLAERGPRTICGPHTASSCEDRSRSPAVSAAVPCPPCCARLADSSRSTSPAPGTCTYRRWPRRCWPAAWATTRVGSRRSPGAPAGCCPHRLHAPPSSCWTG